MPAGEDMVYSMCLIKDKPVAAIYGMPDEQKKMGIPSYWLPYISVENADETAAKVSEADGTVLVPPSDVSENGRMAVFQDSMGATFSIWQAKESIGAYYKYIPGTMSWVELATSDSDKSKEFYSKVIDWKPKTENMGDMEYTTFSFGDNPQDMAGGMYKMTDDMKDIPPHWLIYFTVANAAETVEIAKTNGGLILLGPMNIPTVGDVAVIKDPQGGVFGIHSK